MTWIVLWRIRTRWSGANRDVNHPNLIMKMMIN